MTTPPQLSKSWLSVLGPEFEKPYFADLKKFLVSTIKAGESIYPPGPQIFAAFDQCAFEDTKVIILGQDPYHGPGQAHGLSFSVNPGVKVPPSLKNIYKELQSDLELDIPAHGHLQPWATQGVLLLNATLTVTHQSPASHQGQGWEIFTDQVIRTISDKKEHCVFLLWGNFARSKKELIDTQKHLVLEAAHPSPFSAHNGFFGCRHFSQTNDYLTQQGLAPIDWSL